MSSADRQSAAAGELIERLLVDPAFRAEFRRDPGGACAAAGLPELASEFAASGKPMDTLMVRESRSSLAGVVMAVAVEGMSVGEAQALIHHGLAGAQRGALPRGGSLAHQLSRGAPSAASAHPASPGAAGSGAQASSSAAPVSSSAAQASSSAAPVSSSAAPVSSSAAPGSASAAPAASPPEPGAQPARGGVVPVWPDEPSAGGGAGGGGAGGAGASDAVGGGAGGLVGAAGTGASGLLDSPRLSAPPDARAFLTGGGADPRLVSVLNSALANHSIGLGQIEAVSDPVQVQAIDIVSVDGQPVGPGNIGARDLVTEIAALDPSLRPSEVGTPWPIHAQGFFSGPGQQARLHVAFVSQADYQPGGGAVTPIAPAPDAQVAPSPAGMAVAPAPATDAVAPAPPAGAAAPAPPAGAVAPASVPAPGAGNVPGHYVSMLPDDARIGRTDMGVDADLNAGEPIVAPGTSRVLGITPNWYRGQPYVALQLLDGPMKGHNYYIAEQISPAVSVGEVVQPGQPIGHYAASGTGIEMGWAASNWEQTLAQATSGYSEGQVTPAGASFRNFLSSLRHGGSQSGAAQAADPVAPTAASLQDPNDAAAGPAAPAAASPSPVDPAAASPSPVDPAAGSPSSADPANAVPAPAAPAAPEAAPAPADGSAPQGTAAFRAVQAGHGRAPRPTVQFLPAVQPSPGSPLYGQGPPGAEPQAVGIQEPRSGAPAPPQQPAAVEGLDQAVAPAPAAMGSGSISVSSSLLTAGQAKFAGRLAELTGLDPHVVAAWELAEESGSAAQGREAASNFNWLNIGYFDSGAGRIAFDKTFSDPISAAEQSARFLKGEWGGASPSIRAILSSVGQSPDAQMSAIANSDWASSHYGGGANLHGTYDELSDIHIEKNAVA